MVASMKAGDFAGALLAAEAAAPYCDPRLTAADVRFRDEDAGMSDEELKAEIALLEARIKAAEPLNSARLSLRSAVSRPIAGSGDELLTGENFLIGRPLLAAA